jgi:hypothetical protein
MNEQSITCPKCGAEIKLTESLAAPLVETVRAQYEGKLKEQGQALSEREAVVKRRSEELERKTESLDAQITERVQVQLKVERRSIAAAEAKKAREVLQDHIDEQARTVEAQNEHIESLQEKLKAAQAAEADLLRKKRELDDAKRELALKIERGIQDGLDEVRSKTIAETQQTIELELRDRDHKISELTSQIGDLKRRAEQGSQQKQGEVLELMLEQKLRTRFPLDIIETVGRGEPGADILQHVHDDGGQTCGKILWESKRTKNWQDSWLGKLRGDQRAAGADMAVIVSRALPKEVTHFEHVDGIWVCSIACTLPIAVALREALIQLAFARRPSEGQETKVQHVYAYLTGPRFRQHVEAIVDKFTDMQSDLEAERRVITRQWAKRDEQIRLVLEATAGMYGDLQGIAGRGLEEIEALGPGLLLTENG